MIDAKSAFTAAQLEYSVSICIKNQKFRINHIVNMTMISSIIIFKPMINDDCHDWSWYDICHDCGLLSCSYLGHRVTDTLGQRLKDQLEPNTVHLPQIDNHFLAICTKSWFSGNIRKISYLILPPQVSEGRRWCRYISAPPSKPSRSENSSQDSTSEMRSSSKLRRSAMPRFGLWVLEGAHDGLAPVLHVLTASYIFWGATMGRPQLNQVCKQTETI